ncbi:hypothetical protein GCM10009718_23180 [Isoptericola halotolerans]|uniref:4-amino-4-deoxy-L-arabinose transferase-like glycosyltransferase n=1 Tax=Isoptericola halotolerans TaxID=300560 RepID=A0ABX2A870_9MICO|nr:hypothetical protein [Isoptericola halotolerans]NOV98118.1 4-amino-4-deoxy-L-arabinose transferase-like glycosyltransferase [Isoptericola halotolerans]
MNPPTPPSDEERRYQELLRTAPAKTRWVLLMAVICLASSVGLLAALLGGYYDGQVNHARWFGVVLNLAAGVFFLWGWSKMRHGPVPPGGRPRR